MSLPSPGNRCVCSGAGKGGEGAQTQLSALFSALQEQKVYVQHRLRELGSLVWELLDRQGAYFYLAG